MKNVVSFVVLLIAASAHAQNYNVASIPDSLMKDADMVKRSEETIVVISSPAKATVTERWAYTILNEKGDKLSNEYCWYDKFRSIDHVTGVLYDASGKEIKHIKTRDMTDESGTADFQLMSDTRFKTADFNCRNYPYTVAYEEAVELNGLFNDPAYWYPRERPGVSVEHSKLIVIAPKNYHLRYRQNEFAPKPVVVEAADKTTYTWEAANMPAEQSEPFAPNWEEMNPIVSIAPSDFSIAGLQGNMDSWQSFGKFILALNAGKDVLPPDVKSKVHELADKLSEREKIDVLYNYLQQNSRYIDVDLGIGGWQPYDANYVATKKYGDCKALSNYMVALLKEAGIKANYVLINAGENAKAMKTDFPSTQFNHATVCVPMKNDTLWLECTSQTLPAGYVSDFTSNRKALLIDDDGGHVVSTVRYDANDNVSIRKMDCTIDETGKLTAKVSSFLKGWEQDDAHNMVHYRTKEKQDEELKGQFNLPTYDVSDFSYVEHKDIIPSIEEHLLITADNYASVSSKRIFLTPNILSKESNELNVERERKYDVVYRALFKHIDSVNINVPAGYSVEARPRDVSISNKFGRYEIHFIVDGNKVLCARYYERHEGRYPPGDYAAFVKFYNDMYKADRGRIVLVKKDG